MRNKIVILLILLFSCCFSFAQSNNQVLATYEFRNINDGKFQMILLRIDKNEAYSEFHNKTKTNNDTIYIDDFESINFKIENKDSIRTQYYLTKNEIIFRDHIYTNNEFIPVIVSEKMPSYNWELEEGTLKIGDLICNKASLNFRGRKYSVWYSLEISTQFGPWKFYGLPGLMVKIESEDKSILFELVKVEYLKSQRINKPVMGKVISFNEYVDYQEKIIDDFTEKIRSKLPRGASIKVNRAESHNIEKNFN
ncbi:MAG: GLPGLI family protein [Flavobacteriaceae bacterium]|nr:GLPGLI family protein [Flavobacteriaceae bacterium]